MTPAANNGIAPPYLPLPLQTATMQESNLRVERALAKDWVYCPVGQIVGDIKQQLTVKQVVFELLNEFVDAAEKFNARIAG
jgi:hypothetical protein